MNRRTQKKILRDFYPTIRGTKDKEDLRVW